MGHRYKRRAAFTAFHSGAGEGNRTLVFSLEGCCITIMLRPHNLLLLISFPKEGHKENGGGDRIRTCVRYAARFTVWCL